MMSGISWDEEARRCAAKVLPHKQCMYKQPFSFSILDLNSVFVALLMAFGEKR